MRATPAVFPVPGATMTPAYLHALVDNATLNEFVPADLTNADGGLSAGNDGSTSAWMRQLQGASFEVYRHPISTVSISAYGTRQLTGKVDLAYYKNTLGWQPTKGYLAHAPAHADDTRQDWSGWSAYNASGMWNIPRISIDMKLWRPLNGWAFPATSYPDTVYPGEVWSVVEENGPADGITKVCQYGFCDAFISADLSTELTAPNSVYCALYNYDDNTFVPAAMGYTLSPGYTADIYPLGLVRQVYLASGVTNIPFIIEAESPGSTGINCYVAKVFMGGGTQCL